MLQEETRNDFTVWLVIAALFIFAPQYVEASVVINEIAWMGTVPKEGESAQAAANNEWLELFNSGSESVSLDDWKLVALDGFPNIILHGTIPASGYFLLERGNDDVIPSIPADLIYPFKNNALSNSGEHLFLKNVAGEIMDEVDASSGWQAGDNTTKDTMQRLNASWITAFPTPKKANAGAGGIVSLVSTSSPSTSSPATAADSSGASFWSVVLKGSIKAYAGEDRTEAAGSLLEFAGNAVGLKNEPLTNARFSWIFGDGETAEGRVVSHIFQIPGTYLVGLHVSSAEYATSDYSRLAIVPNQVGVSGVLLGSGGWIKLVNPSETDVDLSGWIIEDSSGAKFTIPAGTKIGSRAEIALGNKVTKIFQGDKNMPLTFRYPNMSLAFIWNGESNLRALTPRQAENTAASVSLKSSKEAVVSNQQIVQGAVSTTSAESKETKNELSAVSSATPLRPMYFFGAAFLFALVAAVGFLFMKRFL